MHPRDHLILSTAAAAAAYPLLDWRVLVPWAASLLAGLALAPLAPLVGLLALGLAFHRLLDDLHGLLRPGWRRWRWRLSAQGRLHARLHRRDGYQCRVCGAAGVPLELHRTQAVAHTDDGLISICRPCHRQMHLTC